MSRRRTLVVGVAAALLLAGAATGVAVARGQGGGNDAPRLVQGKPLLAAAAAYLGLPLRTLKGEIHPGHPLAAIARTTPGRTVAGLEGALFHDAVRTFGIVRLNDPALRRRIAGYVAGLCPLHIGSLALRLGTCPGMSMR